MMSVETALFFESIEEIYARVFRILEPRTEMPRILVRFRKYANVNSRICLANGQLDVSISDLLEGAPAPIQEALAVILISKLFRKTPEKAALSRYRGYLNRAEMRGVLHLAKQQRGRKAIREPKGKYYNLDLIFDALNQEYFYGMMTRPYLGWSLKPSRSTLGHYDPSHNVIVLSCTLDSDRAKPLILEYVMFHEMLHLRYPAEHRGIQRCVHTPAFKRAERSFKEYAEAKRALRNFVETLC